ncbi:hypothetical protein AAFF_G00067850 [Aldrovandia affinis]|uniref:PA domain-containing protein n=1 Tax=Aldrovandia affinis TaxID=143900 RepID=A0AAD7WDK2_9TELE|nr:hypothetical protein AAFF_G00067850 [Aldrovandia affinis]
MARIGAPILLLCFMYMSQVTSEQAFLHVSNGTSSKEYCVAYNPSWTNLSASLGGAVPYVLVNLTSSTLCNGSGLDPGMLVGKAVVVMRGECGFVQKALIAQALGATTVLVASRESLGTPSANQTDYRELKIPLALMRYGDIQDALEVFPEGMTVLLYDPPVPLFDLSILVMLAIGVFTVAMGGYWSGAAEREALSSALTIFVLVMCAVLVLMYFFYRWLVYVIIVMFCLASAMALYSCLNALMDRLGCGSCRFPCLGEAASDAVRTVLLASVCVTLAVVWGVYRNEDRWIWVLQDLLGMAFCVNFMKTITVSNFKICFILLSLLLVYDVFFVFITPMLTSNGESVMVQVAVGSDSNEKLPMVMKVPRFSSWDQDTCGMAFSILGFGDLIVPGLLVAYCHRFDVWINSTKKVYFVSCTVAYLSGMVFTFARRCGLAQTPAPSLLDRYQDQLRGGGLREPLLQEDQNVIQ